MPVYVIGHKNPDTDAICAAIGYADLLRRTTRPDAEAARCGDVPARTAFVLGKAGLREPLLVNDVRPTAGQICRREFESAHVGESLLDAFDRMRERGFRSLPVVDDDGRVAGMVSILKALDLLLPARGSADRTRQVDSSLERVARVLGGTFQNAVEPGREEPLKMIVAALSEPAFQKRLDTYEPEGLMVVAGDRPSVHRMAIVRGVRALVVTGGHRLTPELGREAAAKGVSVVLSPHDTAATTLLVKCAKRVTHAMDWDFLGYSETAVIDDVRGEIGVSGQALFPVWDSDRKMTGVFSKSDLLTARPVELVLVDHNELSQAVTGAEEASILEVLDHHRLGGGLASREPIRFVNEPVGSTSTLVARAWRAAGMAPSPGIALALAAGIISDTLRLTSPTTTDLDRNILEWLRELAPCDLDEFARDFFAAGSPLRTQAPREALEGDCKEFHEAGWHFAVAQIEEQGFEPFWERKKELREAVAALVRERRLDFAALLVTDLNTHGSVLLVEGDLAVVKALDYARLEDGLYDLPGVVSRKKQVIPHLCGLLRLVG